MVSINASNGRESWRGQAGKALQTGVGADGRHAAVVTTGNELVVLEGGNKLWSKPLSTSVFTARWSRAVASLCWRPTVRCRPSMRKMVPTWRTQRRGEPLVLRQQGADALWQHFAGRPVRPHSGPESG